MKRLFNILLMNAWGGIRHMPGLYTAVMILISAMALIVASNVTAGASPDSNLSQHTQISSSHSSVESQALAFFGVGAPSSHAKKKTHKPTDQDQSKRVANQQNATTTPAGSSATNGSNGQNNGASGAGTQSSAALALAAMSQVCEQGQTSATYSVPYATLSFQNPTTTAGTISWQWEVQTAGSNSATELSQSGSQSFPAGTTSVTLPADQPSQPLWSFSASNNYTEVRLLITGFVTTASNLTPVPQAVSCQ